MSGIIGILCNLKKEVNCQYLQPLGLSEVGMIIEIRGLT